MYLRRHFRALSSNLINSSNSITEIFVLILYVHLETYIEISGGVFSSWFRSLAGGVEIFEILWHLFNLGVVMVLDFSNELCIVWQNKVDCHTFSSETTSSTNSMNVVFLLEWKFVVDNETNLLDINTSCEKIGGDEDSGGTSSEFLHNSISLDLIHFTMHG
jgi:hypothetical protein